MRDKKWLALSGVALLATAACSTGDDSSSSEGSSSSDAKKEITMVSATDLPQLDPTLTTDSTSVIVTNNVFEGSYRLDENNQPTPGIAEDVEVSEDGLTYTFKLRDANWSDGSPITAEDFV
ncbi:MAG: peptide ABC transporter substrate-binding protein, partial [Exiguobacterium sp.]|nr:peptide ABC transporter substrate-binding protein [Exiguobacterium sp.]